VAKFRFTPDQIENLKAWKNSLNTEEARNWATREAEAEARTSKVLSSSEFKDGKDLTAEELDDLFSWMKMYSANRNLSNLLYKKNDIGEFNGKLRNLIHGIAPFPERMNEFFKMYGIGIQTFSQFLVASDTRKHPFVTSQTKASIVISSEQDQTAYEDALEVYRIQDPGTYLERTLDYLRDAVIFRSIKELLGLEKYTDVNNLLWFAFSHEGEGPEEAIKSYGSISIEHDLRDFLEQNPFVIEKGLALIQKEYDTKEVGKIDLLCKDRKGTHVVVELKKGRKSDEVVGQTLRYVGWVEKNLDSKVRGIIIVNEPDPKLQYALRPLKNLIDLKYYKVNFEIGDEPWQPPKETQIQSGA